MKTVLVANQKGGVGKTTVSDEIAFALERRGYKVSFQNLDPQGGVLHAPTLPKDDDDFLIVDTPPTLHKDFAEWCRAADLIVMPTRASTLDQIPLMRCWDKAVKSKTKAHLGIAVNFYDKRRLADSDFLRYLANCEMPVWTTIPTTTAIVQAQAAQMSIYEFNKKNKAAAAFEELCDRIIKEVG
ncbi:MAG: ParA family protein [Coriobacteriales bacterium]|jgi:chromosome partitioning protein|nr:ParA family protein [Coriobacteriales bacterium]